MPPRFSSEVLGHRDPGLDRGVSIRHTEGIYSKRLKTTSFKMSKAGEHRGENNANTVYRLTLLNVFIRCWEAKIISPLIYILSVIG